MLLLQPYSSEIKRFMVGVMTKRNASQHRNTLFSKNMAKSEAFLGHFAKHRHLISDEWPI